MALINSLHFNKVDIILTFFQPTEDINWPLHTPPPPKLLLLLCPRAFQVWSSLSLAFLVICQCYINLKKKKHTEIITKYKRVSISTAFIRIPISLLFTVQCCGHIQLPFSVRETVLETNMQTKNVHSNSNYVTPDCTLNKTNIKSHVLVVL